jgi:DNA-binding response OmpR family regulator
VEKIMAHVLLVDDQQFMQEYLVYELTQMGHEVSCVDDGDALFIFLEDRTPDLVLIDPNLNGFEGWDLLQEIKRPGRKWMPTILFTSFGATLRDPRVALAEGSVIKSVDFQGLEEKMSEVLAAAKRSVSLHRRWPSPAQQDPSAAPGRSLLKGQGDKSDGRA